jgi:hypothetical protein
VSADRAGFFTSSAGRSFKNRGSPYPGYYLDGVFVPPNFSLGWGAGRGARLTRIEDAHGCPAIVAHYQPVPADCPDAG